MFQSNSSQWRRDPVTVTTLSRAQLMSPGWALGVEQRAGQQVGGEFLLWSLPDVETTVISRRDQEPGHRQDMTPQNLQRWIFLLPPCCCCWAPPLLSPADDHLNCDSSSQHQPTLGIDVMGGILTHLNRNTGLADNIILTALSSLSTHQPSWYHNIIQLQSVEVCLFPS